MNISEQSESITIIIITKLLLIIEFFYHTLALLQ